jgi:predicted amidohydrolase/predicted RNA methylase
MIVPFLLAQFPVLVSIQENIKTILAALDHAQPGEIVVFPEGAVSGYSHDLSFLKDIDPLQLNTALDKLRDQAQARQIHLWVGAFIPDGSQWFNAAFGFTPSGGAHQYRKINLANHERGVISPGSDLPVFELKMPDGILKVGLQICREIRYPEQWGWLARRGAQVILHLNNAVDDTRFQQVWRSHLISHAASNQRYVVSVNNAASEQNSPTIAISPEGWVLDEIVSEKAAFRRVEMDLSRVSDWYLNQSRGDVVGLSVPTNRERRKILRSMKLSKLQADLDNVRNNPKLYDEPNLRARTEAFELINLIEDMHTIRPRDKELNGIYQQGMELRQQLVDINAGLFTQLRERVQLKDYTPSQLREYFDTFTDYKALNQGQPHYGYEDLDGLISGLLLFKPTPEETLERKPGMIHYQPTPASVILELVDQVELSDDDVFYDLGSGLGQVVGLVNILTGMACVGIEYQPAYYAYAVQMATDLGLTNTTFINADAQEVDYVSGTVFFMFNPFGGRIFDVVLARLQAEAVKRKITICSYGSCTEPIAQHSWLKIRHPDTVHDFKLAVFDSVR